MKDRASLRTLVSQPIISGFAAGKSDQVENGGEGVPQLRPTNILPDGEITFLGSKLIPRTSIETKDLLASSEVLFNNTNSTAWVGKSAYLNLQLKYDVVCSNHITRLRLKDSETGNFVAEVLNMMQRAGYFGWLATNFNNQAGINGETLGDVEIPLPVPRRRQQLMTALNKLRDQWKKMLNSADALLASLDTFVLNELALSLPINEKHRSTYAVRMSDIAAGKKLHPDYFHPERINAIKAVKSLYTNERSSKLSSIADFCRDQRDVRPGDSYLGLANVQPNTGERVESSDEDGLGTVFEYRKNDVLFARLRPYLNKIYRAEADGVCSPEFHVMRILPSITGRQIVILDYLAAVLRSSIVLAQTRHMMTGNTHPRLANEDVVNLVIPIPEEKIQAKIAIEIANRRTEARRLRAEAEELWKNAKTEFETALLGPMTDQTKGGK